MLVSGLWTLSLLVLQAYAAYEPDRITDLPGLTWKPNFNHYSGYLDIEGGIHLHYWFVESSSNPKTDPLVVWFNGGPGCSSMDGMLTEHGPFRVKKGGMALEPNPYAWNQAANMIYLEAPAGVGFSYSDHGVYATNDDEVAKNNHLALKVFFKKFPEYMAHDFYISGESYGGVYVPTLASVVVDDPAIKLKGFIVGNGLSSDDLNTNSLFYFVYYHGLIGESKWSDALNACCPEKKAYCDFAAGMKKSQKCSDVANSIQMIAWGSGLDVYNLYAECAGGVKKHLYYDKEQDKFVTSLYIYPFSTLLERQDDSVHSVLKLTPLDKLSSDPPCTDSKDMQKWLQNSRKELHISEKALPWTICSNAVGSGYKRLYTNMTAQYTKVLAHKLRVLVYNGDVDMACNFLGDEWFVDQLHVKNPKNRTNWFYTAADGTNQIAGYFKAFDHLTFATVKGAGHMVPSDKPIPALKMFISYIQKQPLL